MKVLITAEQLRRDVPGGVGTYIEGLIGGLQSRVDVDPTLLASRVRSIDPLRRLGAAVRTVPVPSKVLTRFWDKGWLRAPSGFGVMHATSFAVPPAQHVPLTVMVHDLGWRHFPDAYPSRGRRWHEAALSRACDRAAVLFTPSRFTADALMNNGVPASRVQVIPLGSDHMPPADRSAGQSLLGRNDVTQPFIFAAGTLEPRKNLQRLIAAYGQVRQSLPPGTQLVIAGPAGWGESVQVPDGVVLLGRVAPGELAALYEMCLLFGSVPLLEGFGLPVVEAMRYGAPVVSSDVPSAGGATYLVDPADTDSVARALVDVANNEDVRAQLVEQGSAHAASLTWRNCAEAHANIWQELTGE